MYESNQVFMMPLVKVDSLSQEYTKLCYLDINFSCYTVLYIILRPSNKPT